MRRAWYHIFNGTNDRRKGTAMSKKYVAFKGYDEDGALRVVGGGTPPTLGKNLGIRWIIGRVEVFEFADAKGLLAFVSAESQRIAR
jgi:hypothetical protein